MRQTIVLASSSPRRRELLDKIGISYVLRPVPTDEHTPLPPREAVRELSCRKALASARGLEEGIVLGADTLVSLDGVRLGKPADAEDARRMLRSLSGRGHDVFTGVCLLDAGSGRMEARVTQTSVYFRTLSQEEIEAYVATGEPMDKAGAYGIQGGAGPFVERIEGSFTNVMGLPIEGLDEWIKRFREGTR